MKSFVLFSFVALAILSTVFADDLEVTKENTSPSLLETDKELDARDYLPRDCFRPVESKIGIACMASIPKWRWSIKDNACVKETYGGCNRTKNNFSEKEDCEAVAKPVCEKLTPEQKALAQ